MNLITGSTWEFFYFLAAHYRNKDKSQLAKSNGQHNLNRFQTNENLGYDIFSPSNKYSSI